MNLWGTQTSSIQIMNGVRNIVCVSKRFGITSGIVITNRVLHTNPLFAKLCSYKNIDTHFCLGRYYFADVNMANMLDILLDDESLKTMNPSMSVEDVRSNARRMLLNTNSEFYMHVTGEDLSIFESRDLLRKLTHSNPDHYFLDRPCSRAGLPEGQILVKAKNGKNQTFSFLASIEDYKLMVKNREIPIQIELYEEFKQAA